MSLAFAPYLPPLAPPPRRPPSDTERRDRALLAVMWMLAIATIAICRVALTP